MKNGQQTVWRGFLLVCCAIILGVFWGCSKAPKELKVVDATSETVEINEALAAELGLSQGLSSHQDYLDATKGLVAQQERVVIRDAAGSVLWDTEHYAFLKGDAPDTVNPSLWRQEKLNSIHGLFKVAEGIYQIRGYDLANMTLIKGDTGWIIVDPLTSIESASAAFAFAQKHLGQYPVKAVIYTHSHIDHFGGVAGVVTPEQVANEGVKIIAPEGFMEEATSENVIVGMAMGRRASMTYGRDIDIGPKGHVGTGLGKGVVWGSHSLLAPNVIIDTTGQRMTVDGVELVFQNTPGSEAPAEMMFYLPERKVLCTAEVATRNMHNLYTLRGAKVRDPVKWSGYLYESRELFSEAEVAFASHHWPTWGRENVRDYLTKQADAYKFIHDQTVGLINKGYTPREIAEKIKFPDSIAKTFATRGYYGTLKHNAKAVYQRYLGWYDANPANLDPLPPRESALRYVALMGGVDDVVDAAEEAYEDGEYRWAAQLLNHAVFAEPEEEDARELLAKVYQQLAFQAESGVWRSVYLMGARELLLGPANPIDAKVIRNILLQTPTEYFVQGMAFSLDAEAADGEKLLINLYFKDTDENFVVRVENSVLHAVKQPRDEGADATIHLTREFLVNSVILEGGSIKTLLTSGIGLEGSKLKILKFLTLIDVPNKASFNIVEP